MDDKVSRNEVLAALEKWLNYYKRVLTKCEELGSKGRKHPMYNNAKARIELLLRLMVEIEEL